MNCLKLEKVVVCMGYVYYVTVEGTVYSVHTPTFKIKFLPKPAILFFE